MAWKCPKCGSNEHKTKELAFTGTGLSRIFDLQMHEFVAIICQRCGYTELYSKDVVGGKDKISDFLDSLLGSL